MLISGIHILEPSENNPVEVTTMLLLLPALDFLELLQVGSLYHYISKLPSFGRVGSKMLQSRRIYDFTTHQLLQ